MQGVPYKIIMSIIEFLVAKSHEIQFSIIRYNFIWSIWNIFYESARSLESASINAAIKREYGRKSVLI